MELAMRVCYRSRQTFLARKSTQLFPRPQTLVEPTSCTTAQERHFSTSAEASEPGNSQDGPTVESFLKSIGGGVEGNVEKVSKEVPDLAELLRIRSGKLKDIGLPVKQRKLILRHTEQYRQGFWSPK